MLRTKVFVDFDASGLVVAWSETGEILYGCFPSGYVSTKDVTQRAGWSGPKRYFEKYGVTASVVRKLVNGFIKSRIYDSHPEINKLIYSGKKCIPFTRMDAFAHEDLIMQCKKDGINNVIPIVALEGKSPMELKKELGKSKWKKICKNSYTKNRKIYLHFTKPRQEVGKRYDDCIDIPYTLCEDYILNCPEFAKHVVANKLPMKMFSRSRKSAKSWVESTKIFTTFSDTRHMAQQLNEPFNPEWSLRRMHEEHERLTRLERGKQMLALKEKDNISFDSFQVLPSVTYNDVIATPLTKYSEVVLEGKDMSHCVGSYASMCLDGNYVVYSLTNGVERTTLGINRRIDSEGKVRYEFNQHFGRCNKFVDNEDFRTLASSVINTLNKLNQKEKDYA